eukprot:scaffold1884_cov343-Ochromonas_danica.AAC.37
MMTNWKGITFLTTCGLLSVLIIKRLIDRRKRKINRLSRSPEELSSEKFLDFDVFIVGAGPAGATAAFYAAKQGIKVGLFDKKFFPRYKPCGDAWCKPALDILEDMGILVRMEADGIVKPVKRGGFISPFGYKCINTDGSNYGSVTGCKTYAIKREIADEYLVRAANGAGAKLHEGWEVISANFYRNEGESEGYWKIIAKFEAGIEREFSTRLLFICDGSTSYLAQKLGIIPNGSQPEAVCSTAYLEKTAWHEADGVMLFCRATLPGYSALFRHYNGDIFLGTYVLPGGNATSRSIAPFEAEAIAHHPYLQEALGEDFAWKKKRTVAPIRIGGVAKPYGQQALLIGDAAGFVDPLTGEGIHTAMITGKIAAQVAQEMFESNNLTEQACEAYALRCWDAFGHDFLISAWIAKLLPMMPIALDAVACVGQRRGQAFLDFFGEVMTGVRPKSDFLQLDLLADLVVELTRQIIIQYILRKPPLIPADLGVAATHKHT